MIEILICGYGNIGKHLFKELFPLEEKNIANITVYDKNDKENKLAYPCGKMIFNEKNLDHIKNKYYDFCFICVPTEMLDSGEVDTSQVRETWRTFTAVGVYVIKSAIPVGTSEMHNGNIVVSPEYWGTTQHCPEPNFMILGGPKKYSNSVVNLYNKLKDGYYKYYFTDWRTAELVKYMENCWIATKVTFCNEFASIAEKFGISYPELRELWLADQRVSPSHTLVFNDKPYYDSHCLNKDIPGLIDFCKKEGIDIPLIESVDKINKAKKAKLQ